MMEKNQFRSYKSVSWLSLLFLASWVACSSAKKQADQVATSVASPDAAVSPSPDASSGLAESSPSSDSGTPTVVNDKDGVQAELSSSRVTDAGIVLVTVKFPTDRASSLPRAKFEETDLPFYALSPPGSGVYQTVLGVPYNHKPGSFAIEVRIGKGSSEKIIKLPLRIREGSYKSEILKVDKNKVHPSKEDSDRIAKERAEVGEVYKLVTADKMWNGPFALPLKSVTTSPFGTKRVFNGEMKSFHQGLDFRAAIGTPISAAAPAIVALAKDLFMSGNTVILDHGYGVFTLYFHMSKLAVSKGQKVKTGDLLGLSGKTGRVSGPHLHWGAVIHKAKVSPIELTRVMR